MSGLYIVFEGSDGSGKSTMSKMAYDHFRKDLGDQIIHTRHPGSTPLGKELRTLIKHREDVPIDPFTESLMFLVDNSSFCFSMLKPAIEQEKIVLADRSNLIGEYAYGPPKGVDILQITNMHSLLLDKIEKIDLLIVYDCPWDIAKERLAGDIENGEQIQCRIEKRGDKYFEQVVEQYLKMGDDLKFEDYVKQTNGQPNIVHIDGTKSLMNVMQETLRIVRQAIECGR